ncbi:MAG: hypothetical protein ABSF03_25265 [Streptosporangiaceae bacterium]
MTGEQKRGLPAALRVAGMLGIGRAARWARLEDIGLGVVQGTPRRRRWLRVRRVAIVAVDVDTGAGGAAVWLATRLHGRRPETWRMLYERAGAGWCAVGGGGETEDRGFLAGRPSALTRGPASLLVSWGSSAARSSADRAPGGTARTSADARWIACETFRVATEVTSLQVGGRSVEVPAHGKVIVAWVSPPTSLPTHRPPIACLRADRTVLTELASDEHVDSATLD